MQHAGGKGIRPDVIIRKSAAETPAATPRKIIIDLLKSSAIIADNFTGSLVLHFNQGGITGSEKIEKGVL